MGRRLTNRIRDDILTMPTVKETAVSLDSVDHKMGIPFDAVYGHWMGRHVNRLCCLVHGHARLVCTLSMTGGMG